MLKLMSFGFFLCVAAMADKTIVFGVGNRAMVYDDKTRTCYPYAGKQTWVYTPAPLPRAMPAYTPPPSLGSLRPNFPSAPPRLPPAFNVPPGATVAPPIARSYSMPAMPSRDGFSPYMRFSDADFNKKFEESLQHITKPNFKGFNSANLSALRGMKVLGANESLISAQVNWAERLGQLRVTVANNKDLAPLAKTVDDLIFAAAESNPFQVVDALIDLNREFDVIELIKDTEKFLKQMGAPPLGQQAIQTLQNQLQNVVTDRNGIILGLPDTTAPIELTTKWGTREGNRIRDSINQLMVSKSVIESEINKYCESANAEQCSLAQQNLADFRQRYIEMSLIAMILDRGALGFSGLAGGRMYVEQEFAELAMESFRESTEFTFGFAKGVAIAGYENVVGTFHMVLHPIDTFSQLGTIIGLAYTKREKLVPFFDKLIHEKFDEFQSADAQRQGEMIGRIVGEVIVFISPTMGLSAIFKKTGMAAELSKLVTLSGNVAKDIGAVAALNKGSSLMKATVHGVEAAVTRKIIKGLNASKKITDEVARSAVTLSNTIPRVTQAVIQLESARDFISKVAGSISTATKSSLIQLAKNDTKVKAFIDANQDLALAYMHNHGPESLNGLVKLGDDASTTAVQWERLGISPTMSKFTRSLGRGLDAEHPAAVQSVRNLSKTLEEMAQSGAPMEISDSIVDYLTRQAVSSEKILKYSNPNVLVYSIKDFKDLALEFVERIPKIDGVARLDQSRPVTYMRAIKKYFEASPGKIIENGKDQLQTIFQDNIVANHSLAPPGRKAIFGTVMVGDKKVVEAVVLMEAKAGDAPMIMDVFTVNARKVLDLTDPVVFKNLGLKADYSSDIERYRIYHQIEHIARSRGYDVILFPVSKRPNGITGPLPPNVAILR